MSNNAKLRPVLTAVLLLVCAHGAVRGDPVADPEVSAPEGLRSVSPSDYAGTATFTPVFPTDVPAGTVLTNFVTAIKVWEGNPSGFDPRALPFQTEDVRFFDEQGNVLDFETDTWNVDGESVFWVRVPAFVRTSRIVFCWGLREGCRLPEVDPTRVWSDYAGVWHLTDATDSTTNRATAAFGTNAVQTAFGQVGGAAGTRYSGQKGAILDIESNAAIDALAARGAFTVSGWVCPNRSDLRYGALFSRASARAGSAWGAWFAGGTAGDSSAVRMSSGVTSNLTCGVTVTAGEWAKFDFVYATNRLAVYIDGALAGESVYTRKLQNGTLGRLSFGGLVAAAGGALGADTLNGFLDEIRLRAGVASDAERALDRAQCGDDEFYTRSAASWDDTAVLQNRWKVEPAGGRDEWNEGEEPAAFTNGVPWYGESVMTYEDRASGETLAGMPTAAGDYRAVFTVAATNNVSSLRYEIAFRIRKYRPTHDLGSENDRILLLNNDLSVADGLVSAQSYSDSVRYPGRPYWVHDVDTLYDYTSTSPLYNFCGGLRHTYYARGLGEERRRLWDLIDVRYGNTYNNADQVFLETGDWEMWDEGLSEGMNYLPWNPEGGTLADDFGLTAGGWHEYAAQAVMCNSLSASINSGLYTNGIGTIYFDCVNSHTEDATNGYCRLVVEWTTNSVVRDAFGTIVSRGEPTDEAIAAKANDGTVTDPYGNAEWMTRELHVRLVNGESMEDLGTTNELTLALAGGGSYTNFYRVYVPVDFTGSARFRIRRTAVNPDYTTAADVRSMILVDNVICSRPVDRILLEPRGFHDPSKTLRETVGYEGAFTPSYPSVSDRTIYPRARARFASGAALSSGDLSSVTMHYRWRYLNQQATDWLTASIDPETLVGVDAIAWPLVSGDFEYWFSASRAGEFFQYADYSGLGLGLPGYSEEVTQVEGRASTYDPAKETGDWFTRIRDGKSTYGAIRIRIRKGSPEAADEKPVEMFVARDQAWRGCLLETNAVAGGIYFRFEAVNRQDDTLADFQFNTNCWYFSDAAETLPASGSVAAGTTNDWGWIPWDGATGHILFQLDESTRALSVVHADWQDFNGWDDAAHDWFSGSSTDDVTKKGVSPAQREYESVSSRWTEDCATNDVDWAEDFRLASYAGYSFYTPFEKATSPRVSFPIGEGMWVRGAYADASDESGMALQMAGQGRGWIQMVNPAVRPRGIESVRFGARIAQTVSPGDFAYYSGSPDESAPYLNDYTFLTRAAFDTAANSNFVGNASLSLAAFYQPNTCCYEARWEQLTGDIESGTGRILGPRPRGQRLALYRWKYSGQTWSATELYAATNAVCVSNTVVCSWNATCAPQAIPAAHSISNGLMPFMVGAYNDTSRGETLVIAAVCIPGGAKTARNVDGFMPSVDMGTLGSQADKGWLYLVYRDKDANRLTRGTYGVLSANCEGVFVRPEYHKGIVSWLSATDTKNATKTATQVYPKNTSTSQAATFYNAAAARNCQEDIVNGYWIAPDGRMERLSATETRYYNGFRASVVTQTVDIYTAPIGTTSWPDEPVARHTLTGFGRPGYLQGVSNCLWISTDSSVRIRTGGTITSVRTDVVVDNIQITQWAGQNWLGSTDLERGRGGRTNFVYTSGWITDGALQLSPRRKVETSTGYGYNPCSLRAPLCDGLTENGWTRGLGLGSVTVHYRNAQTNASLLVQIATNGLYYGNLLDYTLDPDPEEVRWTTVTNWDFSAMTPEDRADGHLSCALGLHGVSGVLRVVADNPDHTLYEQVAQATDPTAFGSVEIVDAVFRDEPALDKGCWWGFNIRTLGTDTKDALTGEPDTLRMYLPDLPLWSANAGEYGRSLAINNSIEEGCDPEEAAKDPNPFKAHLPFLQTPTFASNIVGEVSFRARKYSRQKGAQDAEVTLYGTTSLNLDELEDRDWTKLNIFVVSNTTYETYRFKVNAGEAYRAFRFAVSGVRGVTYPGHDPVCGSEPVRVLLDDVLVSEAVGARIAFRNVGAFRHHLTNTTCVANVPSESEQPICGEGWGVQAEIYPAMLGEEIDMSETPRVKLHYYKGLSPWGYRNWKSLATSAWLTRATDVTNYYRSSALDSPKAVIPMSTSGEFVQYMLEVVYQVVNAETGAKSWTTNWLESTDWEVPSWYHPVDLNATLGGNDPNKFAAYSIIDAIAPGWAWINEINLFGSFDNSFRNSDRNRQFVEVVKPVDYDLDGWTLQMLAAKSYGATQTAFLTNTVATFRKNGSVPATKAGTAKCSYMSFIVVGNPTTTLTGTEYDGAWSFPTTDNRVFNSSGELGSYYPVSMRLVRPSGVIEHEVAILGTNAYESVATSIAWQYASTNMVRLLKANDAKSTVFSVPDDLVSTQTSVGVTGEDEVRCKSALCWDNAMTMTPGDLNEGQEITPDYPRPGGELIMVFASVDTVLGHIRQTVGAGTNTTEAQTLTLRRGSEAGLDIKYSVDPWYELGTVTETEGKSVPRIPIIATNAVRQYTVNVGKGATESVTVVASAVVESRLRRYGLDEHNRYTPAVLHWLENHKDADGNDFYGFSNGSSDDTIYLADFLSLSGAVVTNMTLTQMYWLDMDPTASNMFFRAGMVRPPSQVVLKEPTYDPEHDPKAYTNLRMGVYMSISNGNGHATHDGKSVWAPYVLRGLGPGELSWNYRPDSSSSGGWTSETFKVTGFLNSGLTRTDDVNAWIPLRYFVFGKGSFDANFEAEIDVYDPFSTQSPAYAEGWSRYVEAHEGKKPSVFMSWNIDERLKPITAEILAPTNRLDGTGPK